MLTEFLYSTVVEFPTIKHTWQQWQRDISISSYKCEAIKYDMIQNSIKRRYKLRHIYKMLRIYDGTIINRYEESS